MNWVFRNWQTISGVLGSLATAVLAAVKFLRPRMRLALKKYQEALEAINDLQTQGKAHAHRLDDLNARVETISATVQPNGGKSMVDALQRIEVALHQYHQESLMLHTLDGAAFWRSDHTGACVLASPALVDLVGGDPRGTNWLSFVHPEDRSRMSAEWADAVRERRDFAAEYRFLHKDGRVVGVKGEALAVFAGDSRQGTLIGYIGTLTKKQPPTK